MMEALNKYLGKDMVVQCVDGEFHGILKSFDNQVIFLDEDDWGETYILIDKVVAFTEDDEDDNEPVSMDIKEEVPEEKKGGINWTAVVIIGVIILLVIAKLFKFI
jgi:small nuclear ribonucleoprotein (snRNP)-like protein